MFLMHTSNEFSTKVYYIMKKILVMIFSIILFVVASSVIFYRCAPQFGASPSKIERQRIERSPNFKDGKFVNLETTPVMVKKINYFKMFKEVINSSKVNAPKTPIETKVFDKNRFLQNDSAISMTWFGHSTVLLRVEGINIITDPVFSKRASPFSFAGTKAFNYTHEMLIDSLPAIDYVIISHDHYDHLDYNSIKKLNLITKKFLVPLGVRAHLERWGVPSEKIVDLDWWEKYEIDSLHWFVNTPARHFSGRRMGNRNSTLFSSWVINIGNYRLFFGGDSGYGLHFKQIGDKYGPFNLTMLECGQYNEHWAYIHSFPEQTIQANIDLKGKQLLPIHWGKFLLNLSPWHESIERARKEAQIKGADIVSPTIGEVVKITTK